MDNIIIKIDGDPSGLKPIVEAMQAIGQLTDEQAEKFNAINASYVERQKLIKAESAAAGESADQVERMAAGMQDASKAIAGGAAKESVENIKRIGTEAGQAAAKQVSLRSEINKTINSLAEMRVEGKQGTAQYKAMEAEVAELKRTMMETRGAVGSLAHEFGGLRAASEAIHGLSASMEVGVGISSMFAGGNEKVEKEIQSMMGVMMIANGLQEASNMLKADSILRLKAEAMWENVLTKAKWLEVEATAAEQVATAGWIGLAVAGVAAVVYGIYELISTEKKHEEEQRKIKENIEDTNIALESQKKIYEELGLATTELDKALEINEGKKLANERAELARERKKGVWNNLKQQFVAEMLAMGVYDLRSEKEQEQDKKSEQQEQEHQNRLKFLETKAADEEAALSRDQFERIIKNTKNGFERELSLYQWSRQQERIELVKKGGDLAQQKQFDIQTNKEAAEMIRKNTLKNEAATIEARLALIKKGGDDERKLQVQLAGNKNRSVQTDPNASVEEKKKAAAEFTQTTKDINTKYYAEINKQIQDEQKRQLQTDIQNAETKRAYEIKGSQEDLALMNEINAKKLELANVGRQMSSDEEEAWQAKQTLEDQQYLASVAEAQNRANQAALQQLAANRLKQLQLQKEFHKSQAQIDKMYEEEQKQHPDENSAQVYEAVAIKLQKQKSLEKQAIEESIKLAKQASDEIFATENENRNRRYNLEIERLQKQSSFELDNHNLTQAQKIAIGKKYDKEIAAIKLQQWKADQKSKEEQAIINGALAITNILATMNWADFGIGQAIAIAAATASTIASVGTIAGQKPPQFAKGTPKGTPDTPAGFKWVGEQGPELINDKGGYRVIPHEASMKIAEIASGFGVPSISNFASSYGAPYIDDAAKGLNGAKVVPVPVINEDSLSDKIAKKIGEQTRPIIQFDKTGFKMHLVSDGMKRTVLNNKFKT